MCGEAPMKLSIAWVSCLMENRDFPFFTLIIPFRSIVGQAIVAPFDAISRNRLLILRASSSIW